MIPFNLLTRSHFLVAAVLSAEHGIAVRNGCFCAHPYLMHLLGLTASAVDAIRTQLAQGDRRSMPGMVRVSFGLYNTTHDVDSLVAALQQIARGDMRGRYEQDRASGECRLDHSQTTTSPWPGHTATESGCAVKG